VSVIPLKIDGPNPTVVEKQENFDVEGNAVLIGNLEVTQLNKNTSNVSYDFCVGDKFRSHLENTPRQIPNGGAITLHPGSALIIETREYVHLPRSMFGIIAPKVSLLQQGLSTTFSKVDPGYHGPLLITLFNLGQTTRILRKGDSFCAFSLIKVIDRAELYEQGPKQLDARIDQRLRDRVREWLEAYHVLVMILLIIVTAYLATVHLISLVF
jgi:deoxycytidine triphosphate deaminase